MLLAIDIGNTNIVIGCIEAEKICHELRLATDLVKTSDQYWMDLKGVLALYDLQADEIEGVIISSVVPPVLNSLRTAVMKLTGRTPMVVGPGLKTGLNIAGGNAGQVGSDLVVAAVAALRDYPAPVIIIDMGTATTMMAIDQTGTFLGGSICPGVKVSSEVLTTRTSQLPGISLEAPKHVIGRNTIECMQSGIMLGAACMIDGMIERMEEELGVKATVVATGGISRFVLPMCRSEIRYDRDLLLRGLRRCGGSFRTVQLPDASTRLRQSGRRSADSSSEGFRSAGRRAAVLQELSCSPAARPFRRLQLHYQRFPGSTALNTGTARSLFACRTGGAYQIPPFRLHEQLPPSF